MERRGSSFDFGNGTLNDLAGLLEGYYTDIRKKDGSEYKKASYVAARSAIQGHLDSVKRDINIFHDAGFSFANKVLNGSLKTKKLEGREPGVEHKPIITGADW